MKLIFTSLLCTIAGVLNLAGSQLALASPYPLAINITLVACGVYLLAQGVKLFAGPRERDLGAPVLLNLRAAPERAAELRALQERVKQLEAALANAQKAQTQDMDAVLPDPSTVSESLSPYPPRHRPPNS